MFIDIWAKIFLNHDIHVFQTNVKMVMWKHHLEGALEKKTLTLREKVKFLDYAKKAKNLIVKSLLMHLI